MFKIEELLNKPYWIIDLLPMQVPKNSDGQYFAIEKYYLKERFSEIRQKHIDVILKLNCYRDISIDGKINPAPERISDIMYERAVYIITGESMVFADPDDTHMTLYNPDEELLGLIRNIAYGEGMHVWKPILERKIRNEMEKKRYFEQY